MLRTQRPAVEVLESRCTPTANIVNLQGGILNILATRGDEHVAAVTQTADGVQVSLDGQDYSFTGPVTRIFYQGGDRADSFTNNTAINALVLGGRGNDILVGGTGDDTIDAGGGDNFIQDPNGTNILLAGNGANNIYGGVGNDTITAGSGANVIYDIVGVNTVGVAGDGAAARDYLFVNAQSTVLGAEAEDIVVRFFAPGRTPGTGSLVLEDGVLYFTGNNLGNRFLFNAVGSKLVVTYDLNDGAGVQTARFNRSDVKFLAGFGGAASDTFINNTGIGIVAYGQGGNDAIVGGTSFNLLKGGSGDDYLEARGHYNDLTGNSGNDTLKGKPGERNIFRTDIGDTVLNSRARDTFIGVRPGQGG